MCNKSLQLCQASFHDFHGVDTLDKYRVKEYDPARKEQWKQWRHAYPQRPKKNEGAGNVEKGYVERILEML